MPKQPARDSERVFAYEHRTAPLLPWSAFRRRLARHALYALSLIGVSLLAGTAGFYYCSQQPLVDAFLNAAMLLGGMGAVGEIRSTAGKLFAAAFALYAGLVFLAVKASSLVRVLHRLMHKVHLEEGHRGH